MFVWGFRVSGLRASSEWEYGLRGLEVLWCRASGFLLTSEHWRHQGLAMFVTVETSR